jgi:hypothetical protein
MTREGFARLAFEAHYDADHGEGGWEAWPSLAETDGIEHSKWLAVGSLIDSCVRRTEADHALEPEPAEPLRYALVEQMGFRRTYGTIRETEFCGRPMLEVTSLETGAVHLAAPESLYQLTWLTRAQAEAATRTGSHSPAALSAAIADDLASWGADDEYGTDEGKDDGMSAAERDEHADLHGFALDAADEARDLEREAGADL